MNSIWIGKLRVLYMYFNYRPEPIQTWEKQTRIREEPIQTRKKITNTYWIQISRIQTRKNLNQTQPKDPNVQA